MMGVCDRVALETVLYSTVLYGMTTGFSSGMSSVGPSDDSDLKI